jgi:phospholipid/cholesterol/gamma-HCH transport system substrate-binding protein
MISRFVRFQLVIFVVLSLTSLAVIALVYGRVPELLGFGQRTITVRLTDAAGLYDGARVSYQGIEIGRVTDLTVDQHGAAAELSVSDDYDIPANSRAEVHSVTAIGEQYIDFVPDAESSTAGQYLADGAVIPASRTRLPTSIGSVLENANRLVETLPTDSLTVALDELSEAFNGTGPDLERMLNQGLQLVEDAQRNLGPTERLITDAEPLLRTQTATSTEIRSLVSSLGSFTEQVNRSDPALRRLLDQGPPALAQADAVLRDLRPTLPVLLSNLINVEESLVTYNPSLEQLLVLYPRLTTAMISATRPSNNGSLGLDMRPVVQDPKPCTVGFLPRSQHESAGNLTAVPAPDGVHCKLPQDHPSVVRGVRNLPCLEFPGRRASSPQECRERFAPEADTNPWAEDGSLAGALPGPGHDGDSGTAATLDGQYLALGGVGRKSPREEDLTWQNLLLGPVGH